MKDLWLARIPLQSLSDWVRTIRSLVQGRIRKHKKCVNSRTKSVFKDQEAVKWNRLIFEIWWNFFYDATSHIILDNLYLGEKGSTPPLSSPKSLRSLR
jgi:hypothetical protein